MSREDRPQKRLAPSGIVVRWGDRGTLRYGAGLRRPGVFFHITVAFHSAMCSEAVMASFLLAATVPVGGVHNWMACNAGGLARQFMGGDASGSPVTQKWKSHRV